MVRLRTVITRLSRQLRAVSTDEGLTPSQASVLGVVASRGPIVASEIARVDGFNPTMLSRIVAHLEQADLVTRTNDPSDGRTTFIMVTKLGRGVHTKILANRYEVLAMAASGIAAEEQDMLAAALPALESLAERLRADQNRS
jgi:DNA-binding MarR family transcriptional regulator